MPMLSRTAVLALVVVWGTACGGQSQVTGDEESGGEGGTSANGGTGGSSKGGTTSKGSGGSGAVGGSTGGSGAVGGSTGGTGAVGGSTGGTGAVGGSTGGTGAVGGSVGGSAGTGASGGSGGSMICCTAEPVCGLNEQQISGPAACPPGAMCHAVSACCSTIWCATEVSQCDAYPTCDEGDTTLDGPCPPNVACYTRSLCGSTVSCIDACDPQTEYNRNYVSEDPQCREQVGLICPIGLAHFENDCGCGCEQDATCPEVFHCQTTATDTAGAAPGETPPGAAAPIPLPCDPAELMRCPLSEIVLIRP
jgi:hypothetical protein